jgi:hypothetical protein
MTPLAASIAKSLTIASGYDPRLDIRHNTRLAKEFKAGAHYFECTDALLMANEFAQSIAALGSDDDRESVYSGRVFLPAPRTWIEWKDSFHKRHAVLLVDNCDGWASAFYFSQEQHLSIGRLSTETSDFERSPFKVAVLYGPPVSVETHERYIDAIFATAHCLLVMINTPRIIGRKQHMPNRALERRLTQHFGKGKFPLLAWTEIQLNVAKPIEIDDGEPHEAHLTGRRALHFCRAHLRIRRGQLEYVTSHWRGDPAIGIKQSRYKIVA